jgi:hypothetical protein
MSARDAARRAAGAGREWLRRPASAVLGGVAVLVAAAAVTVRIRRARTRRARTLRAWTRVGREIRARAARVPAHAARARNLAAQARQRAAQAPLRAAGQWAGKGSNAA